MTPYQEAGQQLIHRRTGQLMATRIVAHNTVLRQCGSSAIAYRLHDTDIVTLHEDGRVTLDSGGWRTMITKERINRFAPAARVFSKKAHWMVEVGGVTVPFFDGITYDPASGQVDPDPALDHAASEMKRIDRVKREVRAYLRDLSGDTLREVAGQVLAGDTAGDCFYCLMRTEDGQSLGDAHGIHDHLELHVEERYYVPSMIINAYQEQGGPRWQQLASMDLYSAHDGRSYGRDGIIRVLRKYLIKRLGQPRKTGA